MPTPSFSHLNRPVFAFLISLVLFLPLSACGSGSNLYNGSGGGGTAAAALQIANIDISHGNYSGAISTLSSYCPNNNCVNSDIANAYANSYLAMGNTAAGATVTGTSPVTGASTAGATTSQILTTIFNLIGSSPNQTQIMQALASAIPCLSDNTCNTVYLDNLATALAALANTSCSGSPSVSSDCPDSSTILIVSAAYLLVVAQYDTGLTYSGGTWELCPNHGGGTSGCSSTLSETAIASDLSGDAPRMASLCEILGATCNLGTPGLTFSPQTIPNVIQFFASTLPASSSSVTNAIDQFLYSIYNCSLGGCSTTQTSANFTTTGLATYLSQL